jgi:hypothetical protein
MSVVTWVWERFHGTPEEKLVMLALASRCDKHGVYNAPYSEQDIIEDCGFDVMPILERLIDADAIQYRDSAWHIEAYKRDVLETQLAWYLLREAVASYLYDNDGMKIPEAYQRVKDL